LHSTAWNAELEGLQEEFFLLKEERIRLLGEQLKASVPSAKPRPSAVQQIHGGPPFLDPA
jgi:hypothetical protein